MAVNKILKTDLIDENVVYGIFEESDHYALLLKVKINDRRMFRKRMEGIKKIKIESREV